MRYVLMFFLAFFATSSIAQEDTTEIFDFSKFGDAEGVKRYCTQKVLNQSAQRIVSLGYEYNGSFAMPDVRSSYQLPMSQNFTATRVSSIRAQFNIPVISNNKFIWQLGANYWGSKFSIDNPGSNQFVASLNESSMTSAGINSTIFKPLNEKNFLIIQGSADANGIFKSANDLNAKAVTISATVIYGWKKSDRNMIGTGLARTYRAGQVIHVPVLFWNKTFNDKWGMELLLPARGFLRYNVSTTNMFQAGFELEGNQFWMNLANSKNGSVFIQRGEMKPKIMWDKKISGFLWFNAQAGLRYNWRFDVMDEYNARKETLRYFTSNLGNPLYFNISLNFVSP